MTNQGVAVGRSWEMAHRGVRLGLLVVGSAMVINLLLLPVSIDTTAGATSVSIHMPQETSALEFVGLVLTVPAGWLLGLFVGPAIHWVIYARSPWKQADDHYKRGVKAYEAERLDEAIVEFSKALDLSGGEGKSMKWDAHAYAYRAGAYALLEDIGRAVSDLQKARSLNRDPDLKAHVESQLQELREEISHSALEV